MLHLPSQAQRLAWLADALPTLPGTGIVYTLTVATPRSVAAWLRHAGITARAYSGAELTETRLDIERELRQNELKCVVATSALGMGYDKPDLAFVVHFQVPGSAVAYYQQVGRAGRALDHAYGIALVGSEDRQIQDWFINTAFPSREHAEACRRTARRARRLGEPRASSRGGERPPVAPRGHAEDPRGRGRRRTRRAEVPPHARALGLSRGADRGRDRAPARGAGTHARVPRRRRVPDGVPAPRARRSGGGAVWPVLALSRRAARVARLRSGCRRDAVDFLRRQDIVLEPRRQWPNGSRIPAEQRAEAGRVLCEYGDGGWGTLVKEQKVAGHYDDELVDALAQLVRRWSIEPGRSG